MNLTTITYIVIIVATIGNWIATWYISKLRKEFEASSAAYAAFLGKVNAAIKRKASPEEIQAIIDDYQSKKGSP